MASHTFTGNASWLPAVSPNYLTGNQLAWKCDPGASGKLRVWVDVDGQRIPVNDADVTLNEMDHDGNVRQQATFSAKGQYVVALTGFNGVGEVWASFR